MAWGASRATLVTYVVPAIGLVLGAVFLQEKLDWRIAGGSILIIAGIVLAGLMGRASRAGPSDAPTEECAAAL